jgi:peptide chain release factor 2
MKDDKAVIDTYNDLLTNIDDLKLTYNLSVDESDADLQKEAQALLRKIKIMIDRLEMESYFTGEMDTNDAILEIHPGAGGTESQDWANMLLRMYLRHAESKGFKVTINEVSPGEGAGIKSATLTASGKNAYGLYKAEKGVHRLVRISPFDASRRRHTSFASVDVTPVLSEEIEVKIDPKDLRVETYRSSGAGGQHVNVTDSAVRITHIPSKIVVSCQNERSQILNRATCMKILTAKLYEYEQEKKQEEMEKLKGEKKEIAWGSQIRSYVLHPYRMIKDHRTNIETGKVDAVLDGDLDTFILGYHHWRLKK